MARGSCHLRVPQYVGLGQGRRLSLAETEVLFGSDGNSDSHPVCRKSPTFHPRSRMDSLDVAFFENRSKCQNTNHSVAGWYGDNLSELNEGVETPGDIQTTLGRRLR